MSGNHLGFVSFQQGVWGWHICQFCILGEGRETPLQLVSSIPGHMSAGQPGQYLLQIRFYCLYGLGDFFFLVVLSLFRWVINVGQNHSYKPNGILK